MTHFQRVRTKADRRHQSVVAGAGDAIIGWVRSRQHRWTLKQLLKKHNAMCALCGLPVGLREGPLEATVDHILPLCRGGTDLITNLQLAHRACNSAKGDK